MRTIGEQEALYRFERWVARYPNQRDAAKAIGMSLAYLNDQLHGRRKLSEKALNVLRLRRVKETRFEIVVPQ